jgi:hypothetical protein
MGTPRPSVTKRQREQVKREKQLKKAEKRAQRKLAGSQNEEPQPDADADHQAE